QLRVVLLDARLLALFVGETLVREERRHTEHHDQSRGDREDGLEHAGTAGTARVRLRALAVARREVDDGPDTGTTEGETHGGRQVRVEARVLALREPDVADGEL